MTRPIELYTIVRHDPIDGWCNIIYGGFQSPYITENLSHAEDFRNRMQRNNPQIEYRIYKLDEVIGSYKP